MIDQYPSANGVLTSLIWRKTAAGGETSLSGYDNASQALSYTPGQEQVYLNGILLVRGLDYTATNGTSITGLAALAADDFVQINCYNNFSVASVPSTSITGEITNSQITSLATSKLTGTIANNQLTNSSITINGNAVSLGGSVSLPGDIESVTAGTGLSGGGTSGAVTLTNTVATTFDAAGDLVYGTGSDTFTKLSLGTAGQVLKVNSGATAPEWAAPSGAARNYTLLNSGGTALTGNTTITVSGISGKDSLYIFIIDGSTEAASQIYLTFNGDSNNNYAYFGGLVNANRQKSNATGVNHILVSNTNSFSHTLALTASVEGCNSSGAKMVEYASGSSEDVRCGGGYYTGTSTISSISVQSTNQNWDAGTLYVYGA